MKSLPLFFVALVGHFVNSCTADPLTTCANGAGKLIEIFSREGEINALHNHNQTLQNSLESANTQVNTLTANLAAAHIAKQQAEAAAALAVHTERAQRDEVVRQLSKTEALAVGLGVALTVGVVFAIGYWVYCGVSSYNHNKSKEATHQQLKACIEGDDASLAKSRNCEKEFHEFARYAQGEELLLEQQRITGRTRTS